MCDPIRRLGAFGRGLSRTSKERSRRFGRPVVHHRLVENCQQLTRCIYYEERCLFCGSEEMTEEHLIPGWVFRAIQRTRRPRVNVLRHHLPENEFDDYFGHRQDTAQVVCGACNSGWISRLDNAASQVLKPLIRGEGPVLLDPSDQRDIAAWCLKIALVNDVAARKGPSRLRQHAAELMESGEAPAFFEVWHGPPSMEPNDGLAVFGVLPNQGKLVLGRGNDAEVVPLPSWSVMLGYCDLLLRSLFRWIPLEDPPTGFRRLWPSSGSALQISPRTDTLPAGAHCVPAPSWAEAVSG